jgi:hypothetical protein
MYNDDERCDEMKKHQHTHTKLMDIFSPHSLFLPLHIPIWKPTSAGTNPGKKKTKSYS